MANRPNPVGWFEIYVDDLDRAKTFYETVLQTTLSTMPDSMDGMLVFPDRREGYGSAGAIVKMAGVSPGGGGTLVYFMCDDCAVEAERAAANGGRIHKPKFSIAPYGQIALVIDTEGNMIGLHSMN